MGRGHLTWYVKERDSLKIDIIALNDIYTGSVAAATKIMGEVKHTWYTDYRKLIESKDVDGVLVATPEHWHCKMGLDVLAAGKDMYLEKPLSLHLHEAKTFYNTYKAKYTDRVLQLGNQNSSDPKWGRIRALLPQIGKIIWSQNSYTRNTPAGEWNTPRIPPDFKPEMVDWRQFLGTEFGLAPNRPFDADRFFHWRKYWDYSSGICGDLLAHRIYPFLLALYGDKPSLPKRVVAMGGQYVHKTDREVPDTFLMTVDYPDDHTIFLAGSTENETGVVPMIRGQKGNITMSPEAGGKITLTVERPFAEDLDGLEEPAPEVNPVLHEVHRANWIDCMRTRKRPNCHIDLAYPGMVALALADISYKSQIMALYDPVKDQMINPPKH
jgi:predicted dehydrogenase